MNSDRLDFKQHRLVPMLDANISVCEFSAETESNMEVPAPREVMVKPKLNTPTPMWILVVGLCEAERFWFLWDRPIFITTRRCVS